MSESTQTSAHLRLAFDIAEQFRSIPFDESVDAVATHIRLYWESRMRIALIAAVDGARCNDALIAAVVDELRPKRSASSAWPTDCSP